MSCLAFCQVFESLERGLCGCPLAWACLSLSACCVDVIVDDIALSHKRNWWIQVCNHPDLFEGRPIVSAFDMDPLQRRLPSIATTARQHEPWAGIDLASLRLVPAAAEDAAVWETRDAQASS